MKQLILLLITLITSFSFSQEKEILLSEKKANNHVFEGNTLIGEDDFVSAEMEYRKAISEQPTTIAGIYNLGNSYYEEGNFEEAMYRHEQAAKTATSKSEKHKAFHNIGNILMKNKKCKEAVEAYKNALRNNPKDDETRYNLGLAKVCAEEQKEDQQDQDDNKDDENKDKNQDENKENEDQKENDKNKDNKDKEGENEDKKDEKKDEGDKDKKEGDDEKDKEEKPKDDKGKGDSDEEKKDQQKQQPQQGQLSPQQIKNLLEAMNNQEKEVQEKMNAEKRKGVKIKTDKDW